MRVQHYHAENEKPKAPSQVIQTTITEKLNATAAADFNSKAEANLGRQFVKKKQ